MDSKIINQHIRADIWSQLKELGFSQFASRTAWRYRTKKTDVINFQSFNSYLADSFGCTTYSFATNIGCYFLDVPNKFNPGVIKEKDGKLLPEEYQCHFRCSLGKNILQQEFQRENIWYIDPKGKYLKIVINDAIQVIRAKALPWFEKYESSDVVLSELLHGKEHLQGTFGYGGDPSPNRSFLIGHIALVIGEDKLAITHLQAAFEIDIV